MKLLTIIWIASYYLNQVQGIIEGNSVKGKGWMALLLHMTSERFCGGTVYSSRVIITAAHCSIGKTSSWRAYPGLSYRSDAGKKGNPGLSILKRYNHPGYYKDEEIYDISVWWVNSNTDIRTNVVLAEVTEFNDISSFVYFLGWGSTNIITREESDSKVFVPIPSNPLLKAGAPFVSDKKCAERYKEIFYPEIMFCTGEMYDGPAAGVGDSGGPIYRERNGQIILIGVINTGIGCGYKDYKDINARITNKNIKDFLVHYINNINPKRVKNSVIINPINKFVPNRPLVLPYSVKNPGKSSPFNSCPVLSPGLPKTPDYDPDSMSRSPSPESSKTINYYQYDNNNRSPPPTGIPKTPGYNQSIRSPSSPKIPKTPGHDLTGSRSPSPGLPKTPDYNSNSRSPSPGIPKSTDYNPNSRSSSSGLPKTPDYNPNSRSSFPGLPKTPDYNPNSRSPSPGLPKTPNYYPSSRSPSPGLPMTPNILVTPPTPRYNPSASPSLNYNNQSPPIHRTNFQPINPNYSPIMGYNNHHHLQPPITMNQPNNLMRPGIKRPYNQRY